MGAGAAVGTSFIEESGVGVAGKDHVAGAIHDAAVGVGGNLVEKLVDCSSIVFGGGRLSCADGTDCYNNFVVDVMAITDQTADDALDALDAGVVEGRAGV